MNVREREQLFSSHVIWFELRFQWNAYSMTNECENLMYFFCAACLLSCDSFSFKWKITMDVTPVAIVSIMMMQRWSDIQRTR